MKLTYEEKAARIVEVFANSTVPTSWHCFDELDLVRLLSLELEKMDQEEEHA